MNIEVFTPEQVADDEPIPLAEAAVLFFRGRLTKSALRTEARKGNLEIIRIANKDFVTRNGINRMIEKCRENAHRPDSGSDQTQEHGSLKTAPNESAQNVLNTILQQRKQSSQPISRPNINRSAEVRPLR
ncbi:hypothetical protein ACQZ46_02355 [Agrobacterium salinitolerans]